MMGLWVSGFAVSPFGIHIGGMDVYKIEFFFDMILKSNLEIL
jgi:hypothetical protein